MNRLQDAPWLFAPGIQRVFEAVEQDGDRARAVGGAVRNAILGQPVSDIDIATTAVPKAVVDRVQAAGLKAVATGIDHGTVTVISEGVPYELTTLRQDIETFGRQARVHFGTDWRLDAQRRDFTLNALYADRNGRLFDPLGGLADCRAGIVRFIGDPDQRIREDYLRILRFFRMHAAYGTGPLDPEGLDACARQRDGLRHLSAERIGAEMKKLVSAREAPYCIQEMEDRGLLEITTGGISRTADFAALRSLDEYAEEASHPPLCFTVLAGFVSEDLHRVADRFRLSNLDRKRVASALKATSFLEPSLQPRHLREALVDVGRQAAIDGLLMIWARTRANAGAKFDEHSFAAALDSLRSLDVPVFPVAGNDLLGAGLTPGPDLGRTLEHLRSRWRASDFRLSKTELLELL
ncbi:poly(A) polymerase [Roseibium hamelinense]|uniref:Poly(A) polymerase n=1 Tax=Roseibium hamelinense TaxID=150831 RepID=A0A562SYK6_9HYPH|nr:CCA tRNA nucleotidyltransferase [Roseibium hamelinense]MTI43593.1 CCA tRNA nucleotidyltransferase [Roseibium hamelinense]TWI86108.1 poly(A) polymerase [Roseibium hamelinense]